jgi:hypothetical protein
MSTVTFDAAVDNGGFQSATSRSWSHTVGTLTDGELTVSACFWNSGGQVSSCTYGGVALTRAVQSGLSASQDRSEIWRLLAPAAGTATVVVNFSAAADGECGSSSWSNVDQTAPERNTGSTTGSGTAASISATGAQAGDAILDALAQSDRVRAITMTAHTNRVQRFNTTSGVTGEGGAGSSLSSAPDPQTMDWTIAATKSWALSYVVLAAAPDPVVTQKYRPSSDVSLGTWTDQAGGTTNVYTRIDEADTPVDTDYAQSAANPSSDLYEYALTKDPAAPGGPDPQVSTGHILRYRVAADQLVGGSVSLVTELRQGASALSTPVSFTDTLSSTTPATIAQTLSGAQADAITDYTALRVRHTATQAAAAAPTFVGAGTAAWTATNGATFTPTIPNGSVGDLLLMVIQRNDTTAAPTLTGWTNIAGLTGTNSTTQSVAVYRKYATSATGSADQLAITFGTSTVARGGVCLRLSGADPTSPIHNSSRLTVASTAATVSSTNITSTVANTLGIFIAANIGARSTTNATTNWPAGSGVTNFASQQTTVGADLTIGYAAKQFASAGSYLTPGITWTTNTTTGVGTGLLIAIAPATNNSRARVTWSELETPQSPAGNSYTGSFSASTAATLALSVAVVHVRAGGAQRGPLQARDRHRPDVHQQPRPDQGVPACPQCLGGACRHAGPHDGQNQAAVGERRDHGNSGAHSGQDQGPQLERPNRRRGLYTGRQPRTDAIYGHCGCGGLQHRRGAHFPAHYRLDRRLPGRRQLWQLQLRHCPLRRGRRGERVRPARRHCRIPR